MSTNVLAHTTEGFRTRNYRPNDPPRQIEFAGRGHRGQVLADLHFPDGTFYRTAVVADAGHDNLVGAKIFCVRAEALYGFSVAPTPE